MLLVSNHVSCGSRGRRGAALVLVALMMLVLIGFLGLSIDHAFVRKSTQELQAAADAAALAAAQLVYVDDPATGFAATRSKAIEIAAYNKVAGERLVLQRNLANLEDGDIVVGRWDRVEQTFIPSPILHVTPEHDAVMIRARRTGTSSLALFFGQAFGTSSSEVSRTSIAHWGGDWGPGILALHPTMQGAFDLRGTAKVELPLDGIQVNSSHAVAFKINGAPNVRRVVARRIDVHGGVRVPSGSCYPGPTTGADVLLDPLAGLPVPDKAGMLDRGSIRAAGTYAPGWYSGGLDFDSGIVTLLPGEYVFAPPGISVRGTGLLQADRAILFIDIGGGLTVSGTAPGLDLRGPPVGDLHGIAIFQHRDNATAANIEGGGLVDVRGTMYLPRARLVIDGTVDRSVGRLIVGSVLLQGTATYRITGSGHPPLGQRKSFLVK